MKYTAPKSSTISSLNLPRPREGSCWISDNSLRGIPRSGQPGWQSNGGPHSKHPLRAYGQVLRAPIPIEPGNLSRINIAGVFAQYADLEEAGQSGANVELWDEVQCVFRFNLINGRHYLDARDLQERRLTSGDGSNVESVGQVQQDGDLLRVDLLRLNIPAGLKASELVFRDVGSPASFTIFDMAAEFQAEPGCPFKAKSGGISLAELAAAVRVGDRNKIERGLQQLDASMEVCDHGLDEARGMALMFIGVVCSATLELGGSRQVHQVPLAAAREVDRVATGSEIAAAARRWVKLCLADVLERGHGLSLHLMDRAMALVDRNYAMDIADTDVAANIGLSTSHFRALFKRATGQPFHQYLISVRLEKAKQLLLEQELAVGEVAEAVGFTALSHFSRAFTQRFAVSPTNLRRLGR